MIISMNLKPSVPLPDFANLTIAVNDNNENMRNRIIATIKVTVNALVNVAIVDWGTAAITMVKLPAPSAMASILAYTISVNEVKSPLAEISVIPLLSFPITSTCISFVFFNFVNTIT